MESDEYPFYRFCVVPFPVLFEIVDYDSKWDGGQIRDEFPKIGGSFSYIVSSTVSPIFKAFRANVSLIKEQEFGSKKKDGTLTGCYRSIKDNESDVSLALHDFPTIDYEKVDPYQILMEDSVKIMSAYESKTEPDVCFNDFILTSIESFDGQTWFTVLAMVTAFFGLWMIKRALFPDNNHVSLRRRIAETLWDTLLLFISQESRDYYNFTDKLLSILITLSFFFLTNIYFGLMSTDLVSVTTPVVINSYQDVMNRPNITPVFAGIFADTQEFEDAYEEDANSIQAKFWAKYKEKVQMLDYNSDPTKLISMIHEGTGLNRVAILNGAAMDTVRTIICRFKVGNQVFPNVYTWISRDPSARMQKKTFIMRNGMKQTRHLKVFRRKIRSIFETGLFYSALDVIAKDGLQSKVPEGPHSQIERCLSDQVVYADASVDTVVLKNFHLLLALPVVMLPAWIIILLIELYCHRNIQVVI